MELRPEGHLAPLLRRRRQDAASHRLVAAGPRLRDRLCGLKEQAQPRRIPGLQVRQGPLRILSVAGAPGDDLRDGLHQRRSHPLVLLSALAPDRLYVRQAAGGGRQGRLLGGRVPQLQQATLHGLQLLPVQLRALVQQVLLPPVGRLGPPQLGLDGLLAAQQLGPLAVDLVRDVLLGQQLGPQRQRGLGQLLLQLLQHRQHPGPNVRLDQALALLGANVDLDAQLLAASVASVLRDQLQIGRDGVVGPRRVLQILHLVPQSHLQLDHPPLQGLTALGRSGGRLLQALALIHHVGHVRRGQLLLADALPQQGGLPRGPVVGRLQLVQLGRTELHFAPQLVAVLLELVQQLQELLVIAVELPLLGLQLRQIGAATLHGLDLLGQGGVALLQRLDLVANQHVLVLEGGHELLLQLLVLLVLAG